VVYYTEFVRPKKEFRAATDMERTALADLAETLRGMDPGTDAETIQTAVYEVGKRHPFPGLKDWFGCLYQVLLGQAEGPRFGGFVALYGVLETVALIETALLSRLVVPA
jgi:lysyl-tRNA synthetase class 1